MKKVQVFLPFDKTEEVYNRVVEFPDVLNLIRFTTDNAMVIQFMVPDDSINKVILNLKGLGVGVDYGYVDILALEGFFPMEKEEKPDRKIQREASLIVEKIHEDVSKGASLSFDFMTFVILSAIMAGFGLAQNNATVIVASMVLAPLMGPMLGVALGYVVRDKDLFLRGTRNEMLALAVSFVIGSVMGAFLFYLIPNLVSRIESNWTAGILTEITRRGGFNWIDVSIALVSGAAVAISVTRGQMSSLVGVAISAALMPPAVNVGMMLAIALIGGSNIALQIGLGALGLLAMNIVVIDVAAIIMFRIKKLTVISDKSETWRAVTAFKQVDTTSLYHNEQNSQNIPKPKPEKEQEKRANIEES